MDTLRTSDFNDFRAMLPEASPVLLLTLHCQDEMPLLTQLRHVDVTPSVFTKKAHEKWSHEEFFDKLIPMKTWSTVSFPCIYRANIRNVFKNITPGKEIYPDKLSFGLPFHEKLITYWQPRCSESKSMLNYSTSLGIYILHPSYLHILLKYLKSFQGVG